ncbi:MAG: glycosyltransferase family 4 protein [Firmicutes bacterium]|jgi:glycosyltransferase involved in cell wall biosynthesis|nr:glycosyltransferase family 4 protein [Bacillota bacterium]MDH7496241.1 glycosyltransferase family 4 protein [Bacillota bacterium]
MPDYGKSRLYIMRILFVTHYFPPETGAPAARMYGLAMNLSRLGHDVTVVTGYPNYPNGRVFKPYRVRPWSLERMDDLKVVRTYMYVSASARTAPRLANQLSFVVSSSLVSILNSQRYDMAFVSSPPLFLGLSGCAIALFKRCPFVFDVRDIWPEIATLIGELKSDSLANRVAQRLERFLYRKASVITVVTEQKVNKLVEKGVPREKIHVIRNGVDEEFINAPVDTRLRTMMGLDGAFVVLYAGLIGRFQGVDVLLWAASTLEKQTPDVQFLIIGEGVAKSELMRMAATLNLSNVRFLPGLPKEEVRSYLAMADAAVIPLKNGQLTDSVPSKLYEYMGVGCPVILCASGESCDVLLEAKAGLIVPPGDSQALASAILEMKQREDFREACRRNGRAHVASRYLRRTIAKELEDVLLLAVRQANSRGRCR